MKHLLSAAAVKFVAFALTVALGFFCTFSVINAVSLAEMKGCYPNAAFENSQTYRRAVTSSAMDAMNLYLLENAPPTALTQSEINSRISALEKSLNSKNTNFRYELFVQNTPAISDSGAAADSEAATAPQEDSLPTAERPAAPETAGATVSASNLGTSSLAGSVSSIGSGTYTNGTITVSVDDYHGYTYSIGPDGLFHADSYFGSDTDYTYTWSEPEVTADAALALRFGVTTTLRAEDTISAAYNDFTAGCQRFITYIVLAIVCAVLALLLVIFLCLGAGRRKDSDVAVVRLIDRFPWDLLFVIEFGLGAIACSFFPLADIGFFSLLLVLSFSAAWWTALILLFLMSFSVRIKTHTLSKSCLIGMFFHFMIRVWKSGMEQISLFGKLIVGFIIYEVLSLFLVVVFGSSMAFFLLALVNFALLILFCWWALKYKQVRDGTHEIARGNYAYSISTEKLPPDLFTHAQELNHIRSGMETAVREQMKSEHLKSELITNVSHDLKTPLTSIINYVDLLKGEPVESEKAREYIEVLDRQSARLKKLTEDLVDASKASTGAIPVHLSDVDAGELLTQAVGEYSERMANAALTPVVSLPQTPLLISADGQLLWRVIDNLFSNACKYALPGTRVYCTMEEQGMQMVLAVKNISRTPLNIPPEELMERFVRGDASRNSEGSGLGLSIAQSLTELMGGTFSLSIDGDLFKAEIRFPQKQPDSL